MELWKCIILRFDEKNEETLPGHVAGHCTRSCCCPAECRHLENSRKQTLSYMARRLICHVGVNVNAWKQRRTVELSCYCVALQN